MPESENPTKTKESEWITVGGKKIEIKPEDAIEDKAKEKLPSVRGEKEKNTKQALSKIYFKRHDLVKAIFNTRDEVVFEKYQKLLHLWY